VSLILLVVVSVWLLSGVVVFTAILLGAWRYGRRERLEITSRPQQAPTGPRVAGSNRAEQHV
jgi:hypothetical protein